jgi:hypothetical protein
MKSTVTKQKSANCLRNFRKSLFLNIAILKNKILNTNAITKMKEFNSQVCTTKEQSQRLLDLGLKPETADMAWVCVTKEGLTQWVMTLNTPKNEPNIDIPAWSLHRLLLLCDVTTMFTRDILETAYDDKINVIENLIKNGYFNKEYLKQ